MHFIVLLSTLNPCVGTENLRIMLIIIHPGKFVQGSIYERSKVLNASQFMSICTHGCLKVVYGLWKLCVRQSLGKIVIIIIQHDFAGQVQNQGWALAHLLICSLLISALFKRAIVRSLAHLLFLKERMSNCSLQKTKRAIALFVALLRRANEQSLFLFLFSKEQFSKSHFFLLKKKSNCSFSKWANAQPCSKCSLLFLEENWKCFSQKCSLYNF